MSGYWDYWGKAPADRNGEPCHLLVFHSLDVAAVGAELLECGRCLLPRIAGLSRFGEEGALP